MGHNLEIKNESNIQETNNYHLNTTLGDQTTT